MKRPALFMCVLLLVGATASCQSDEPSFDIGSVRPHNPSDFSSGPAMTGRRFVARNKTLRELILLAYPSRKTPLADFSVSGGPGWTATERFDIEVKDGDARSAAELHSLLQSFLAQKFHLTVHHEIRELSGYELVVATPGKAKRSGNRKPQNFFSFFSTGIRRDASGFSLGGERVSLERFADLLQRYLDSPVVDKTGLHGLFDMSIHVSAATSSNPATDAIFEALQDDLGLQLRPSKASVEVIVIDAAEKPDSGRRFDSQ
jgi:uncharacterized protein (TIGR03435 family)